MEQRNPEKQATPLPDALLDAVSGGKSECIYKRGYCPFCRTERDLCALTAYSTAYNGVMIMDGEKCYCKQCIGIFMKIREPGTSQIIYLNEDGGRI